MNLRKEKVGLDLGIVIGGKARLSLLVRLCGVHFLDFQTMNRATATR